MNFKKTFAVLLFLLAAMTMVNAAAMDVNTVTPSETSSELEMDRYYSLTFIYANHDENTDTTLCDLNINSINALGGKVILKDINMATNDYNVWCDTNDTNSSYPAGTTCHIPKFYVEEDDYLSSHNYRFIVGCKDSADTVDWNSSDRKVFRANSQKYADVVPGMLIMAIAFLVGVLGIVATKVFDLPPELRILLAIAFIGFVAAVGMSLI